MPLPHWLTRVNLAFGNRILSPIATYLPGLGIVEHRGRRSGVLRRNPIAIFRRAPDRYAVALWYGPDAQWVRNVVAAGGCRVRTRGRWIGLAEPRVVEDRSHGQLPLALRPIASLVRADFVLELRPAG